MQYELNTGYRMWITKMGKNKKYSLLISTAPKSNEFIKVGLLDDMVSIKRLYTALFGFTED